MRITLGAWQGRLELCDDQDIGSWRAEQRSGPESRVVPIDDEATARRQLWGCGADWQVPLRHELHLQGRPSIAMLGYDSLLEWLAGQLAAHRLWMIHTPLPAWITREAPELMAEPLPLSRASQVPMTPGPAMVKSFAIEVEVVGEDLKGIPDITIELRKGSEQARQARTGSTGEAQFDRLEQGTYQVSLSQLDTSAWELLSQSALDSQIAVSPTDDWKAPAVIPAEPLEHIVEDGEGLDVLAFRHGLFAEAVWNHSLNAALKARRESWNILLPGDVVQLPGREPGLIEVSTNQRYVLKRKGVPSKLHVRLLRGHEPLAHCAYELRIGQADVRQGQTDETGLVDLYVSPLVTRALLIYGDDKREVAVNIGRLWPVSTPTGVQQRLLNLGLLRTEAEEGSEEMATALREFQVLARLPETGALDDATRSALSTRHDNLER